MTSFYQWPFAEENRNHRGYASEVMLFLGEISSYVWSFFVTTVLVPRFPSGASLSAEIIATNWLQTPGARRIACVGRYREPSLSPEVLTRGYKQFREKATGAVTAD